MSIYWSVLNPWCTVYLAFITLRWPIVRCGRWNLFWPFMASRYHYWIQPNQWIMLTAHVTYGLLDFSKTFWSTIHKNTSTVLDTNKQTTDSSYVGFLTVGSDPEGSVYERYSPPWLQRICYSHWTNGARNWVIFIGQWGVFNHEKGAIWQSHLAAQKEGVVTAIIFSNHKTS